MVKNEIFIHGLGIGLGLGPTYSDSNFLEDLDNVKRIVNASASSFRQLKVLVNCDLSWSV